MKTLKSFFAGLALLAFCATVKAADVPASERLTQTHAINTYVAAMSSGKTEDFNEVFDQGVKFNLLRGTKVYSFDKKQMFEAIKLNHNVEQDCTISTSIVESNNDVTVVKVDMKYKDFVRSNYVSMVNTGAGWKITNVYSVFK